MTDALRTIDGVIFDLDGTLVDSVADIANAMNWLLVQKGYEPKDTAFYNKAVGDGARTLMARCVHPDVLPDEQLDHLLQHYLDYYYDNLIVDTVMFEGLEKTLDTLTEENITMAVYSNKPHDMTVEIVADLLPKWTFQDVRGQMGPGKGKKPDPDLTHDLLETLNWKAGNTVMVGDTLTDMETATQAGMKSIGVTWGFRDREELQAHQATEIIDRPEEFMDSLTRIAKSI